MNNEWFKSQHACTTKKWLEMNEGKWHKVPQILLDTLDNILQNCSFQNLCMRLMAELG